jgi:hypothetical protein
VASQLAAPQEGLSSATMYLLIQNSVTTYGIIEGADVKANIILLCFAVIIRGIKYKII